MRSGKSARYFVGYVKVVEVITRKSLPGQFNRTIRMKSCGRPFQDSVVMV